MLNPDSIYMELPESEKLVKCLDTVGLEISEYNDDEELHDAIIEYKFILDSLPYKKAADALREGIIKKTEWIRTIDFNHKDKQGRILYTPDDHSKAIKALASDLMTQEDFNAKFINVFKTEVSRLKSTLILSTLEKNQSIFKEQAINL